jgi:hypothetical protein
VIWHVVVVVVVVVAAADSGAKGKVEANDYRK